MARTVRITGSIAGEGKAVRFLKTASGDSQTVSVDDLYLMSRIARLISSLNEPDISCFGSGYWNADKPWIGDDVWID